MSEFLDVLDSKGLFTGKIKQREKVHRDGDWHVNIPARGNRASRMTGTVIPETGNR